MHAYDPLVPRISEELLNYSSLVQRLLARQGITTVSDAEKFLNPSYSDLHDPFLLNDMERAVVRILDGMIRNEKMVIYADYDADGVPGATVLSQFFKHIHYENISVYIPHRHDEGYGLHLDALEEFAKNGATLVMTVDLGITAVNEVVRARELSIDIIITDHHEPLAEIPDAYAVVNPKLGSYPERMICGCAVAWKLACALATKIEKSDNNDLTEGWEKWLLDLVGISTVSDLVPLVGENRILATYGLKVLQKTRRKGIRSLLMANGVAAEFLNEDDISFGITPKLNAASRMAHPMDAFRLLAAETDLEAQTALAHIENLNKQRKTLVAQSVKTARAMLDARELRNVIVIGHPEWNIGVLGLIASNLVDAYKRPVFVWARNESNLIKGSCRGDGSVNVVRMMESAAETFTQFGGHEHAGGFTVPFDAIHTLEEVLVQAFESCKSDRAVDQTLPCDGMMSLDDVHRKTVQEISQLGPFGVGNPKPVFMFKNISVREIKQFGKKSEHLDLVFENSRGAKIRAIKFYASPDDFPALKNPVIDLAAHIERSFFRGREEIRLRIVDVSEANSGE